MTDTITLSGAVALIGIAMLGLTAPVLVVRVILIVTASGAAVTRGLILVDVLDTNGARELNAFQFVAILLLALGLWAFHEWRMRKKVGK